MTEAERDEELIGLRWALTRLDWYRADRLARAVEKLGPVAAEVIADIARQKRDRAEGRR